MNAKRFSGKTVIVTGSSRGIGLGIASRFAAEGANVVLNARNQVDLDAAATQFDAARCLAVIGDVASSEVANTIVAHTIDRFGGLDVLVNNAGVGMMGFMADATDEQIDTIFSINVKAVMYLARAAIPELTKTNGSIVNISSLSGIGGDSTLPVYNATKGAVTNLTRGLCNQLGPDGVRVNAVLPTFTRTDMVAGISDNDAIAKRVKDRIPLGRIAEVEDIAAAVAFLASNDAAFISGVNLPVDGGTSASNGQANMMNL